MNVRRLSVISKFFLIVLTFAAINVAQAQDVQVTSADPSFALQGTEVEITISGSGFDKSAAVDFFVTGTTNPGGIIVKKIKVRGSKKIIVDIVVDSLAEIADFDIQVRLSGGRNGKGTTLFSVKQKPNDDPCVTSTTFPTFVYATASGSEGTLFSLSDADGSCVQTLTTYEGGSFIQGEIKLDYQAPGTPGESGTGRFVWQDKLTTKAIFLTEFVVIPGNIVTVMKDFVTIVQLADSEGSMGGLDIANDGDSLAFSHHSPDGDGDGYSDKESLYVVSIDGCLAESWLLTDPSACSGTSTEVLSFAPLVAYGPPRFTSMTWSTDRKRIYLDQSKHLHISGIQIAENTAPGVWTSFVLYDQNLLLPPPGTIRGAAAATVDWDSTRPGSREVVATTHDVSQCQAVIIVDVEDCLLGQCDTIGPAILFGNAPSWTSDGRLLYEERSPRGKFNCRTPGKILILDPFDPDDAPTQIVNGRDPDG